MSKQPSSLLIIVLGLALTCLSLILLYLLDSQLSASKVFTVTTPEGETLSGTYIPGNKVAAVLLLEGFGSDQVAMRSLANEFTNAGLDVFSFDFSGQGRSSGGLTFNNAQTDYLAKQVLLIENSIPSISGQINLPLVLIGHSLGGRAALQSAVIDSSRIKGIVLIGPQVNLNNDSQAEFFTGTQDSLLPWTKSLSQAVPNTNLLLLSGDLDDILPPNSARMLLNILTGERNAVPANEYSSSVMSGASREWLLFNDLFHNYEIYDGRIIAASLEWTQKVLSVTPTVAASTVPEERTWLWVFGIVGIYLSLEGFRRWFKHRIHRHSPALFGLSIRNMSQYILVKMVLWLAAVPLILLIIGLTWVIPLPKPVFTLYYVGFIGGYGLLMLIVYGFGLLPEISDKLIIVFSAPKISTGRMAIAMAFNLALFIILALFANTGWYNVPPTGERLLWLLIFTPFTALGFWFVHFENDLIAPKGSEKKLSQALSTLNSLLPFFIYTLVMLVLKSTSGVIGGLQGLLVLALVLIQGTITYRLTGLRWLTAILQAVMLYLMILPTSALFNS